MWSRKRSAWSRLILSKLTEFPAEVYDAKAMKTKRNKNITLNDLAHKLETGFDQMGVMVARGFERTYSDMDDLGKKIDNLDDRIKVVETKLDRALYTELTHIEARLRKVEEKVGIKSK